MRWDLIPISDAIQMTAKRGGFFPLAFFGRALTFLARGFSVKM